MDKSEREFEVGDRVIGMRDYGRYKIKGIKGTVIYSKEVTCVEFDKNIGGHNGSSRGLNGKNGHCAFCFRCLELLEEISTKEEIIIYRKNNEVIATQKRDGKFVDSAKAKCNSTDEFIFLKGSEIAFDRLIGKEDGTVEKIKELKEQIKKQEETILEKDEQIKMSEDDIVELKTIIEKFENPKNRKGLIKGWKANNCPKNCGFDNEYPNLLCSECWKKAIATEL